MDKPYSLEVNTVKCKSPKEHGPCNKIIEPYQFSYTGFCKSCYYFGIVQDYANFHDRLLKGESRCKAAIMTSFIELES